jgi:hypothetical protein
MEYENDAVFHPLLFYLGLKKFFYLSNFCIQALTRDNYDGDLSEEIKGVARLMQQPEK